jgi:branched-chain amino acid transport system substrate-binding protein
VEIVPADSELKPDVATRRANDLLYRDKVDILAVGPGSAVAKAVSQVANRNRKLFITYASEAAELTGEDFLDTTFRCCLNTDMHSRMLALYFTRMAKQRLTKFYLLNEDYNFGHACADGFKNAFDKLKAPDQSIVGEEYHPLQKVQDFGPYVTKIMASGAEIVITGDWGQDLRLLLQQGKSLGWKVRTGGYYLDDPVVLQAVKEAAVGHITAGVYEVTLDTPENKAYIREWRDHYPDAPINYKYPNLSISHTVNAILWVGDVIKRAGTLDIARLIQTWEGAHFSAVWGDVEMRACDHQMLSPGVYIGDTRSQPDTRRHTLLRERFPLHWKVDADSKRRIDSHAKGHRKFALRVTHVTRAAHSLDAWRDRTGMARLCEHRSGAMCPVTLPDAVVVGHEVRL